MIQKSVRSKQTTIEAEDICNVVGKAYQALAILSALDRIKSRINSNDHRFSIIKYLCESAKIDLALSIWKIYFDTDKDANTVKHLESFLRRNGYQIKGNTKLSSRSKKIEYKLNRMRNTYLAHLDKDQSQISIKIADLESVFLEIVEMVNSLCDKSIDDRVQPISEISTGLLKMNTEIALREIVRPLLVEETDATQNID